MRALLAGLLCIAGLAGAASAEDCTTLATQLEMNDCAARAFDAADADLNRTYGDVVAQLTDDPAGLGKLRAAERAWVAFRDAECGFAAKGVETGSIYPMILFACRQAMTEDRLATLKGYLVCPEGDLACPVPRQPD